MHALCNIEVHEHSFHAGEQNKSTGVTGDQKSSIGPALQPRDNSSKQFTTLAQGNLKQQRQEEEIYARAQTPSFLQTGRNPRQPQRTYAVASRFFVSTLKEFLSMLVIRFHLKTDNSTDRTHWLHVHGIYKVQRLRRLTADQARRTEFAIRPVLTVRAFEFESVYGSDVMVPSTDDPEKHVWLPACLFLGRDTERCKWNRVRRIKSLAK